MACQLGNGKRIVSATVPQIIYGSGAIRDLLRLRDFLRPKNPAAAKRSSDAIVKALKILGLQPQIGRPVLELSSEYRDWLIDFGDSGYVARYRYEGNTVTILALRHQKEVGF